MKLTLTFGLLALVLLGASCSEEHIANRGFSLPDGDVENGRLLFIDYKCIQCHTLAGTEFSDDQWRLTENGGIAVELGGEKTRVQTYGDLVTSVINPSHRIASGYPKDQVAETDGESKMDYYNEVMTVADLVDIVTYLKSRYTLKSYPETIYPRYIYHN